MSGPTGNPPGPGTRPGRRALFSGPYDSGLATGEGAEGAAPPGAGPDRPRPAAPEARTGRRAFFSDPLGPSGPVSAGDEVHPGLTTAVVECRTCLARTPMSLAGLGLSLVPSLWIPTRPWPRLMRCPSCHRVAWCRIEWPRLRA